MEVFTTILYKSWSHDRALHDIFEFDIHPLTFSEWNGVNEISDSTG